MGFNPASKQAIYSFLFLVIPSDKSSVNKTFGQYSLTLQILVSDARKPWRAHYCILVLIHFDCLFNDPNPKAIGILRKGTEVWITQDEPKDPANVLSNRLA